MGVLSQIKYGNKPYSDSTLPEKKRSFYYFDYHKHVVTHRNCTTENTVFLTKKCAESLQVKSLRIMFVAESKIP